MSAEEINCIEVDINSKDIQTIKEHAKHSSDPESYLTGKPEDDGKNIKLQAEADYYSQRNLWSYTLLAIICILTVCQQVMIWFIGMGWLDFSEHREIINAVIYGNFAQIIGLALIVVNFLFPKRKA